MAIINPDGLFYGERLARCSDEAQLHWVRLFTASNTFGRIELSYRHIVNMAYGSFHKKPTEADISRWIQEYFENFLLFVYDAPDGSTWGQWLTSAEYLSRYHTAADRRSPEPDKNAIESYRREYLESKSRKSLRINRYSKPSSTTSISIENDGVVEGCGEISLTEIDLEVGCLSNLFEMSNVSEPVETISPPTLGNGIGVGNGIGKGKGKKQKPSVRSKASVDERHQACKIVIQEYWNSKNLEIEMPWDGSEGKALGMFLSANPKLTQIGVQRLLNHRENSEVNHADRPSKWIRSLTSFNNGPIDRFGKPLQLNGAKTNVTVPNGTGNQILGVLEETLRRRQRNRAAGENGDVSAGGETGPGNARTIHAISTSPRLTGVSGSDEESLDF